MQLIDLGVEYATLGLGDPRRAARARLVATRIQERPGASFPSLFDDAELEGFYRLTNNRSVSQSALLKPHLERTWARGASASARLAIHDTTEFSFEGESSRRGLVFSGKRNSFHGHFSLLVEEGEAPLVHGVVGAAFYTVQDGAWTPAGRRDEDHPAPEPLPDGSHRWLKAAEAVHDDAPAGSPLIHVADREGDDYSLLCGIANLGDQFVIRSLPDRRIVESGGRMVAHMADKEFVLERQVHLSTRGTRRPPKDLKPHPPRDARAAHLSIRAASVTVKQPLDFREAAPRTLVVNVVEVVELNPPEGEAPVYWRLLTTLPIDSPEQIARVVDIYRKRWLIEEFFKALKTGCAFEERQAESIHALLNTLAILVPIAVRLLQLRALARHDPDAPSEGLLDELELAALRVLAPKAKLPARPSNCQVLLGIALAGGHLKSNGDPGWIVLGRGLERLLAFAGGWRAALATVR